MLSRCYHGQSCPVATSSLRLSTVDQSTPASGLEAPSSTYYRKDREVIDQILPVTCPLRPFDLFENNCIMLSHKVLLKIFIALCCTVAVLIIFKVTMNCDLTSPGRIFQVNSDQDNNKRKNTANVANFDEISYNQDSNKKNMHVESLGKIRTSIVLFDRDKVFSQRDNISYTRRKTRPMKKPTKLLKATEFNARTTKNSVKSSSKKKQDGPITFYPFGNYTVNPSKNQIKIFPNNERTAGEKTNIVKNVYFETIGSNSIYGHSNCKKNPDRNILDKLFTKWLSMSRESGIEFFLTCGTLLGAYRNGDIIPHDTDMDVLVDRRDYEKIKKYESKRNFSGYENDFHVAIQEDFYLPYEKRRRFTCHGKLTPVYKDHCSFQEPLGRLITENHHLDIYDYSIRGDIIWDPSEGGREFNRSDIFPLQKCMLMGHETKCPNKPKEVLRKFYGDDLTPLTICKNGKWVKKA